MILTREMLGRYLDSRDRIVREMALALMEKIPAVNAPNTFREVIGDRFVNESGQYVISGDSVYTLLGDQKWHHRHPLASHDRATLRLIERGFVIKAEKLSGYKK